MEGDLYIDCTNELTHTDPNERAGAELFKLRCMMAATIAGGHAARMELGWVDPKAILFAVDLLIEEALDRDA